MSEKIQVAVATQQKKELTPSQKMNAILNGAAMKEQIAKALPSVITPERFTRIAMTAVSNNPELAKCTPQSFIGALMQAAQLGLEPNTQLGQAYLIPYKNKGVQECQFQLGYRGMLDLAYRSGLVSNIQCHEVHENDEFTYSFGLEGTLTHKPALKDRGEVIAYYGVIKFKDGGVAFDVMSKEDIDRHATKYSFAYSKGYSSPWTSAFDEMAKKTLLKRLLKYCPLKSDFVKGVAADSTIKSTIAEDMYAVQDETDYEVVEVNGTVADAETGEVVEPKE